MTGNNCEAGSAAVTLIVLPDNFRAHFFSPRDGSATVSGGRHSRDSPPDTDLIDKLGHGFPQTGHLIPRKP